MFCLSLVFVLEILGTSRESEYQQWRLGVDSPYFYSKTFTISDHVISIDGYQEVLDESTPIHYSVVKVTWWGKIIVYQHTEVYHNYKSPNPFNITFTDLPNGENYRIFIYNYGNIGQGEFKIIKN